MSSHLSREDLREALLQKAAQLQDEIDKEEAALLDDAFDDQDDAFDDQEEREVPRDMSDRRRKKKVLCELTTNYCSTNKWATVMNQGRGQRSKGRKKPALELVPSMVHDNTILTMVGTVWMINQLAKHGADCEIEWALFREETYVRKFVSVWVVSKMLNYLLSAGPAFSRGFQLRE